MKLWRIVALGSLLIPLLIWLFLCLPQGGRYPKSDHYRRGAFFNPEPVDASFLQFVYWRLTRTDPEWPVAVTIGRSDLPPERVGQGELRVTFINHATTLIQMDGFNILTDPIWSERASPVSWAGPQRVHPPGLPFEELPLIDIVLISHNHYDSLDLPTIRRLSAEHQIALFVAPLGVEGTLRLATTDPIQQLDWWENVERLGGLRITCVPARHWSQRGLCDKNRSLWGGFVIEGPSGRVLFAGDSGYGEHFKQIKERVGALRLAILPIGAYAPRWFMGSKHMTPEEAVQAHLDLGARHSLGMHFDCFPLGDEPYGEAPRRLRRAAEALEAD
ncbi:MAG: MBL fold metallo-hydrolase, partial [Chlamydiia bacterium]|nr:MBL fold metallo-hydrolase [Chlamydiia bacterium]